INNINENELGVYWNNLATRFLNYLVYPALLDNNESQTMYFN
ncbi:8915_t:CDS:2, partial [Gigaspora margarita]